MAKRRRRRGRQGQAPVASAGEALRQAPASQQTGGAERPAWPWGLALLLMVAAAYWPVLFAGFVWDDKVFILESAQIRDWGGLADIWLNPALSNELHYWPLLNTSFWLDHKLWGWNPAGFHATNLLLHGLCVLLLWRLLGAPAAQQKAPAAQQKVRAPGAWLVAAFFALHPVHAEPVAWITARKDLLATLFYLLAFGAWLRHRAREQARSYLALLALYGAGVLSKTVAITLPAALLVWVWWQEGRLVRKDWAQVAPLLLLGLGLGLYGLHYYSGRAHIGFEHSLAERLVIAGKALWFYAGKLLWPEPLLAIYPHWDTSPARLVNWLAWPAALGLAGALWLARHRIGRGPLAGALFFAITLSPMLGFADNSYMRFSFVADRYQYLASLGLLAALVGGAATACQWLAARLAESGGDGKAPAADAEQGAGLLARRRTGSEAGEGRGAWLLAQLWAGSEGDRALMARAPRVLVPATALAALLLAICGCLALQQVRLFQNEAALFRHVTATNPAAPRAWPSLGGALMQAAPAEAVQAFQKALELEPDDAHTHLRLSETLIALERHEEALALLQGAIERGLHKDPGVKTPLRKSHLGAKLPYNLGILLLQLERPAEAEAAFRLARQLEPSNLAAWQSLASALRDQGRHAAALALLQEAAQTLPAPTAGLYLRMAEIAASQGRTEAAEAYNRQALAINPQSLAALRPYAATQFNAGRYEAALASYRQIAALNPQDAGAHLGQARALEALGRLPEAVQSYERTLALIPDQQEALADLALIHFNAKRFAQAAPLFQRLAALNPNSAEAHTNLGAALAQSGRLPEAVQSFERALALDPQHETARHALALAKQQLNQQRQ